MTKLLSVAALALAGLTAPLLAQTVSDTLSVAPSTDAASIPAVRSAAVCIAKREPNKIARMLSSAPFSAEEKRVSGRLMETIDYCSDNDTIMSSTLRLRSAATEWLYEQQFGSVPQRREPAAMPAAILPDTGLSREAASFAPVFALAQCAVAAEPDEADALLRTEPSSDAEVDAFNGMGAMLADCARGAKIHVDRETLRGALAESLYRWSVVQRDGVSSRWASAAGGQEG